MPITLTEDVDSREWSGGTATLRYTLRGTASDTLARSTLMGSTPVTYNGMVREKFPSIAPVWADTVTDDGLWECTVRYTQPDAAGTDVGTVRISWSTQGGNQHVTQALQHISSTGEEGSVSLIEGEGAIGYNGESVEGVDIPAPTFAFEVTKRFAAASAPSLSTIYAMTARVNNGSFTVTDSVTGESITLAAGECIFYGAQKGNAGDDGSIEIVYAFAASPNRTNIVLGGITVPAKKGWEYLWVEYRDAEDADRKTVCKTPYLAHVERVFELGTFSALGL